MEPEADAQALLDRIVATRGYVYPSHRYLAENDPGFLAAFDELVGQALSHDGQPGELPPKYREMVVCAILAFRGASTASIAAHAARAIRLGATERELLEAFEASLVPGGAPTFLAGVNALISLRDTESSDNES